MVLLFVSLAAFARAAEQAAGLATTAEPAVAATLQTGSAVSLEALAQADWIKGAAPREWEPDKVYVFECWATWCGPCILQIPHLNELHRKYAGKGLRVHGMDVWEDDRAKVASFVAKKGEGMSYAVAFVGGKGAFDEQWLKPAAVTGIPFCFLVKGGKLVTAGSPQHLTEEVVEALLLPGDQGVEKAREIFEGAAGKEKRYWGNFGVYTQSLQSGDLPQAKKATEEIAKLFPDAESLPLLRLGLAIGEADWPAATRLSDQLPEDEILRAMTLRPIVNSIKEDGKMPVEFSRKLIAVCSPLFEKMANPDDMVKIGRIQWAQGDKQEAAASVGKAVRMAGTPELQRYGFKPEPYRWLQQELEKGAFPSREEMAKRSTEKSAGE